MLMRIKVVALVHTAAVMYETIAPQPSFVVRGRGGRVRVQQCR